MFTDKVILITGGTGSFGNAAVTKFLALNTREIRIFSRDEKKQDDMRKAYQNNKLKFYIGDVREYGSIKSAVAGVDYIFSAAALKQVPSCEFFPMEAVNTNIIGTDNVLNAALEHNVKKVIVLSTDKAVYPINAMGMSKALMEKIMVAKSRESSKTVLCGTRYGNVMASRGSVIPLFIDQIKSGKPITITNPNMTRFMMSLDSAIDLVLYAFSNGKPGDIFVHKAPAFTIADLVKALMEIFKTKNEVRIIGERHGEKLFESLLTSEEVAGAEDLGEYFRVSADTRDLNYAKFFEKGEVRDLYPEPYTSHNTRRLELEEVKKLLLSLDYVKKEL
ncbi:MAG: polysaccharide biosynthesis protein [Spirochaetales bacterium]|nr:polysaccharide biosynthesis protein [Spirochaetales bacterium]